MKMVAPIEIVHKIDDNIHFWLMLANLHETGCRKVIIYLYSSSVNVQCSRGFIKTRNSIVKQEIQSNESPRFWKYVAIILSYVYRLDCRYKLYLQQNQVQGLTNKFLVHIFGHIPRHSDNLFCNFNLDKSCSVTRYENRYVTHRWTFF